MVLSTLSVSWWSFFFVVLIQSIEWPSDMINLPNPKNDTYEEGKSNLHSSRRSAKNQQQFYELSNAPSCKKKIDKDRHQWDFADKKKTRAKCIAVWRRLLLYISCSTSKSARNGGGVQNHFFFCFLRCLSRFKIIMSWLKRDRAKKTMALKSIVSKRNPFFSFFETWYKYGFTFFIRFFFFGCFSISILCLKC